LRDEYESRAKVSPVAAVLTSNLGYPCVEELSGYDLSMFVSPFFVAMAAIFTRLHLKHND
jgi:hypothetical protein